MTLELLSLEKVLRSEDDRDGQVHQTPARSRQPATVLVGNTFSSAAVSPARSAHRRNSTAPA